jgi:hypothetical protein
VDTSHVRNIAPMLAKRRALADAANEANAIQALLKLGWQRNPFSGVMLPPARESVKTDDNA